jgi:hypothetical protein
MSNFFSIFLSYDSRGQLFQKAVESIFKSYWPYLRKFIALTIVRSINFWIVFNINFKLQPMLLETT